MSEEEHKEPIECTVVEDDDGDIKAVINWNEDDEKVVSDKYKTKFILCSARCVRKHHVGFLGGNVWICVIAVFESTDPFVMLGDFFELMKELETSEDD